LRRREAGTQGPGAQRHGLEGARSLTQFDGKAAVRRDRMAIGPIHAPVLDSSFHVLALHEEVRLAQRLAGRGQDPPDKHAPDPGEHPEDHARDGPAGLERDTRHAHEAVAFQRSREGAITGHDPREAEGAVLCAGGLDADACDPYAREPATILIFHAPFHARRALHEIDRVLGDCTALDVHIAWQPGPVPLAACEGQARRARLVEARSRRAHEVAARGHLVESILAAPGRARLEGLILVPTEIGHGLDDDIGHGAVRTLHDAAERTARDHPDVVHSRFSREHHHGLAGLRTQGRIHHVALAAGVDGGDAPHGQVVQPVDAARVRDRPAVAGNPVKVVQRHPHFDTREWLAGRLLRDGALQGHAPIERDVELRDVRNPHDGHEELDASRKRGPERVVAAGQCIEAVATLRVRDRTVRRLGNAAAVRSGRISGADHGAGDGIALLVDHPPVQGVGRFEAQGHLQRLPAGIGDSRGGRPAVARLEGLDPPEPADRDRDLRASPCIRGHGPPRRLRPESGVEVPFEPLPGPRRHAHGVLALDLVEERHLGPGERFTARPEDEDPEWECTTLPKPVRPRGSGLRLLGGGRSNPRPRSGRSAPGCGLRALQGPCPSGQHQRNSEQHTDDQLRLHAHGDDSCGEGSRRGRPGRERKGKQRQPPLPALAVVAVVENAAQPLQPTPETRSHRRPRHTGAGGDLPGCEIPEKAQQ